MNIRDKLRLKEGDTVVINAMAHSDTGTLCKVAHIVKGDDGHVAVVKEDGARFPNGNWVRFISYKCLDLAKGESDG